METTGPLSATAIFGGSFNPPGLHHRAMAGALLATFPRVLVVPCGFRPDKVASAGTWLPPATRQRLVELTFSGLDAPGDGGRLEFDWSDLYNDCFTPTIELARRYFDRGEIWFVAGADLFADGAQGLSQIQTSWKQGMQIWQELNWVCLTRPGFDFDPADLPPRHRLLECKVAGSSSSIRERMARGESLDGLVVPEVAELLSGR